MEPQTSAPAQAANTAAFRPSLVLRVDVADELSLIMAYYLSVYRTPLRSSHIAFFFVQGFSRRNGMLRERVPTWDTLGEMSAAGCALVVVWR
jgi:hypothetical protein